MNKKMFSSIMLVCFFSCCFSFSCAAVQKKMSASANSPDCSGIDYDKSWFYEWERTVTCAEAAERKDFDRILAQVMDFMAGEYHFLRNDMKKGEKFFSAAFSGPDKRIIKAVRRYVGFNDGSDESFIIRAGNEEETLFDRYINILGAVSEKIDKKNIDSFYELYSEVLGTGAPPLLYNIAFVLIYSGQIDEGSELLKITAEKHPELKKIQYDANNKEFAEPEKNIINDISH